MNDGCPCCRLITDHILESERPLEQAFPVEIIGAAPGGGWDVRKDGLVYNAQPSMWPSHNPGDTELAAWLDPQLRNQMQILTGRTVFELANIFESEAVGIDCWPWRGRTDALHYTNRSAPIPWSDEPGQSWQLDEDWESVVITDETNAFFGVSQNHPNTAPPNLVYGTLQSGERRLWSAGYLSADDSIHLFEVNVEDGSTVAEATVSGDNQIYNFRPEVLWDPHNQEVYLTTHEGRDGDPIDDTHYVRRYPAGLGSVEVLDDGGPWQGEGPYVKDELDVRWSSPLAERWCRGIRLVGSERERLVPVDYRGVYETTEDVVTPPPYGDHPDWYGGVHRVWDRNLNLVRADQVYMEGFGAVPGDQTDDTSVQLAAGEIPLTPYDTERDRLYLVRNRDRADDGTSGWPASLILSGALWVQDGDAAPVQREQWDWPEYQTEGDPVGGWPGFTTVRPIRGPCGRQACLDDDGNLYTWYREPEDPETEPNIVDPPTHIRCWDPDGNVLWQTEVGQPFPALAPTHPTINDFYFAAERCPLFAQIVLFPELDRLLIRVQTGGMNGNFVLISTATGDIVATAANFGRGSIVGGRDWFLAVDDEASVAKLYTIDPLEAVATIDEGAVPSNVEGQTVVTEDGTIYSLPLGSGASIRRWRLMDV